MPSPIMRTGEGDTDGSMLERIVGRDAHQRSTKTLIPSTLLVSRLGILRNHATRLLMAFRALHKQQFPGDEITDAQLRALYTCVAAYSGFHQEHVEHLSSFKGFTVRSVTGRGDTDDQTQRPSSLPEAKPAEPAPGAAGNMRMT